MSQLVRLLLIVCLATGSGALWAVAVGEKAPDFTRPSLEGNKQLKLSQYRGKVVYLDFWASWCGPCRLSLPALEKVYEEFADQGFTVIAVNVGDYPSDAKAFLASYPVSYTVLRDANSSLPKQFGVRGMPTAYLIDRSGRVRMVHEGFRPGDIESIRRAVASLLREPVQ